VLILLTTASIAFFKYHNVWNLTEENDEIPNRRLERRTPLRYLESSTPLRYLTRSSLTDVCSVAKAMESKTLSVKSYYPAKPIEVSSQLIPHASISLCNNKKGRIMSILKKDRVADACFVFKAARTGSTSLESVIDHTLKHSWCNWEPFCSYRCDKEYSQPQLQEKTLNHLFLDKCEWKHHGNNKCIPNDYCKNEKSELTITLANTRFFNENIDWNVVFQDTNYPRVIVLRRTNLIQMSFSKYLHGGCQIDEDTIHKGIMSDDFTLDVLLRCVEHYALGDQEIASSRALQAAESISDFPLLVLYEDIASAGEIVQKNFIQHFNKDPHEFESIDIFTENNHEHKLHSGAFCDYDNVNCVKLREGLEEQYPCLFKQLVQETEGYAWTTPILPSGVIDVRGDCRPLPFLTEKDPYRSLYDIYQFEHGKLMPLAQQKA